MRPDGTPPDRMDMRNLSMDRYWLRRKEYLQPIYTLDDSSDNRPMRSLQESHGTLFSSATLPLPYGYLAPNRLPSSIIFDLGSHLSLASPLLWNSVFIPCQNMDSGGSSTNLRPTVEDRMEALESVLGRLRARADHQDKQIQENIQAGEKSWDILNENIRNLREYISTIAKNLEELKEDTQTALKDEAISHGIFGNRICTLEEDVNKILAKIDK